ncbi:hypothetical protein TNCV_4416001 [Trichonephila clavipes]|uniref:Uncharacterized protein n=1 Tax=Trichonephila clavipes TaxID=2585209 RepID=A0A8X6S0C4_TRICX|nr:hypothetical protein TNCV_4416001 [Trichonephila clavipes]
MRLEELVKEQALKEKELQLKFDLERFKIESGFRIIGQTFKSATQIAELFDNYEDVRKVNSKPMGRWGRNDKILTYSGIKEKENRFGKTSPRLGASVPESTRERTFEKRVIQRCYHCNMPDI